MSGSRLARQATAQGVSRQMLYRLGLEMLASDMGREAVALLRRSALAAAAAGDEVGQLQSLCAALAGGDRDNTGHVATELAAIAAQSLYRFERGIAWWALYRAGLSGGSTAHLLQARRDLLGCGLCGASDLRLSLPEPPEKAGDAGIQAWQPPAEVREVRDALADLRP